MSGPPHPEPSPAPLPVAEVARQVGEVPDPELPMIGLGDLGVVESVAVAEDGILEVAILPTFLGCPALPAITASVREVLVRCGHPEGRVRHVLAPAWSSDRISARGRSALAAHGIAPPAPSDAPEPVRLGLGTPCPYCGSLATRPRSAFGPARCQSMLHCAGCRETFPLMTAM
ncbi:1,2-phenylacetyl-CoA epoxidase subunit PaaD [Streptomyces albidoflavus]|uniref:1,2-phenylacetyl-CoA epoxidase subunit PaaD n=1 Tax=Streptomyces TaxID=1883 RepID=UPI001D053C6F|nr:MULTISPECIES: 1,2-phenylacetyl-CoA epoxidase subunit PaaD [unclassified Streptomyces]MCQ9708849.1 phenylacetate-CoA oxygenase subunit PaaJ [Streptomyces sp. BSP1]UDF08868.1 phenylacetate-CoA oxygenase subunit PaaJ [Streptomyces sp. WA1-19]UYX97562.1 phenylacetate-CoA oxygenase subunit PaaJ [Streptomyces sp. BI87]